MNNYELSELEKQPKPHVIAIASSVFLRILALFILGVSILFWSHVLGYNGPDIQQTFNANKFQGVVMAVLAVVTPLLGVGLWLGMSWARILWGIMGTALLVLHFTGQPINLELLTFGVFLMVLLIFYYLAQLYHLLIFRRKRNKSIEKSD
ncbi:MAG: DUF6163 family protein [Hyphomicrobiales bacterium]